MVTVNSSIANGLASANSTWSQGRPPLGDLSEAVVIQHVVEVDGTYTWGDDSAYGVLVPGDVTPSSSAVQTAANGGNISGFIFTDTTHHATILKNFCVGQTLTGTGVTAGTKITACLTGTGHNSGGTYTVDKSQTVTNQTITGVSTAGTLKFSRTASSALTCGGGFVVSNNGTLDDLLDQLTLWATFNQQSALLHTVAGSTIDLGAINLVCDSAAGSVFSYAAGTLTIKTGTLAAGSKFAKVQTSGTITTAGSASISCLYQSNLGPSAKLVITLPLPGMSVDVHSASAEVQYLSGQSGVYTLLIPPGATGAWAWAINKQGYAFSRGSFSPGVGGTFSYAPACPQILTSEGSPMYQGTTSPLVQSSYSAGFSYVDIGNGTPSLQNVYDSFEDYLTTSPGMDWIVSGRDSLSIFNSFGGDYLFLTGNIRLRRWHPSDANATVPAFAQSVDGMPVDEVNGPVRYNTSDNPAAIAAAVWAALPGLAVRNDTALIPVLL